tara:strand:+ start:988 stop:2136 length:1149 start_codon:yes stop_codon:yes gene_type:complete
MRTFKQLLGEEFLTEASYNKGDVFEFVFSATCVARFTDRYNDGAEKELTPRSVRTVMNKYFSGHRFWTVDSGDGVPDSIEFQDAAINDHAMNRLADVDYRESGEITHMIERAIEAVENKKFKISRMATEVITNGIQDDIEVVPVGTSDQSGTKSDVDVVWSNREPKPARIRISLKLDSGQFGQFAGADMLKAMTDAWASLGMPLSSANKTLIKRVKKTLHGNTMTYFDRGEPDGEDKKVAEDKAKLFPAIKQVFRNIARVYGHSWLRKEDNIDLIMAGFKKSILGREPDLEAILGVGSKTQIVDKKSLKRMKDRLLQHAEEGTLKWVLLEDNENPTLALMAANKTVFQVRLRWNTDNKGPGKYKLRMRTVIQITRDFFSFTK